MKFIQAILAIFIISSFSNDAFTQEKEADSKIQSVTVFFQGAQIERTTASVNLPAGQTVLAIKGLEESLSENSVRTGIKGNGVIQTIVKRTDYLNLQKSNEKILELNNKLKKLEGEIEDERMKLKVYDQERNFLTVNMKLGGVNNGVNVTQIKEGAAYFRSRLTDIETLILSGNRKIKVLNEERSKISRQLSEMNYIKNKPTSTLEVTIDMEKAGPCSLLLNYYIPKASWRPLYDLRVEEIGKPVQLIRKASVVQSSGTDWKGVKLTFSTGNPQENQLVPFLNPWYIDIYTPGPVHALQGSVSGISLSRGAKKAEAAPEAMAMAEVVMYDEYDMGGAISNAAVSSRNSILEFTLASKSNIPSDKKEYMFSIGTEEMDASYHYQSVPKLNKAAYLMATIKDWETFELVDGVANIYYEKTFVGETYLSTSMTLDSMQLSLGKDKGLVVERKSVKDFTKTKLIGQNVKKSFGYEIIIRNTKSIAVNLVLEDQYPVSANSEISIEREDRGKGVVDESTGKVTWRLNIKPGETLKVPLKYTIKYPKDMQIDL